MLNADEAVEFAGKLSDRLAKLDGWYEVAGEQPLFASGPILSAFHQLLANLALQIGDAEVLAVTGSADSPHRAQILTAEELIEVALSETDGAVRPTITVHRLRGLTDLKLSTNARLARNGRRDFWPGVVSAGFRLAGYEDTITITTDDRDTASAVVDTLRRHWLAERPIKNDDD